MSKFVTYRFKVLRCQHCFAKSTLTKKSLQKYKTLHETFPRTRYGHSHTGDRNGPLALLCASCVRDVRVCVISVVESPIFGGQRVYRPRRWSMVWPWNGVRRTLPLASSFSHWQILHRVSPPCTIASSRHCSFYRRNLRREIAMMSLHLCSSIPMTVIDLRGSARSWSLVS